MMIPASLRSVVTRCRVFHEDERGETSVMANIMLLAVAALVVVALIFFGNTIIDWLKKAWEKISGSSIGGQKVN